MYKILTFLLSLSLLSTILLADRIPSFVIEGEIKEGSYMRLKPEQLDIGHTKSYTFFDPYLKKEVTYEGILLKDFVSLFGNKDTKALYMSATDGYIAKFTKEEWESENILLAFKIDANYMDYKNFGPLKVVYPDYDKTLADSQIHFTKWIWMIKTIEFIK